jgi:hypothetical protein
VFNLDLPSAAAMQATPQTSTTSFFQIASIHGIPYKIWNDTVGPVRKSDGSLASRAETEAAAAQRGVRSTLYVVLLLCCSVGLLVSC